MHGFMIRFLILRTQGGRSWSMFENTLDVVQDKLEFKKNGTTYEKIIRGVP